MSNHMPSAGLRARVALDKHSFRTNHSLGQNFLLDDRFLSALLDETKLCAGDCVLEIGPGAGVMTTLMAERGAKVVAVELDEKLRPVLEDVLAPTKNAEVIFADFMKTDVEALAASAFGEAEYRVVANLPYYITADILTKLTTCARPPRCIDIMVQKEAAERLLSAPGEKQWGTLAATVAYYGTTRVLTEVPPDCFDPAPHVMSAFIEIERHPTPLVCPKDEMLFRRVIAAAFAMRRKTLANNLSTSFKVSRAQALRWIEAAGLPEKVRGEVLTPKQLCAIADLMHEDTET